MLLEGLYIPLTTPFHRDARLHPHKLAANVLRYSRSPASGLIALAPYAGEPTLLTDAETIQVLETVAESAAPEKVLLADISRDSVVATLALAERAAALGYDAVLVRAPQVLTAARAAERITYLRTVADRSPLPVVLATTSDRPSPPTSSFVAQLATHPNILGLFSCEQQPSGVEDASEPLDYASLLHSLRSIRREVTVTATFGAVTNRMLRAAIRDEPPSPAGLVPATALARNSAQAAPAVAQPATAPTFKTRTKSVGFQVIESCPRHLLSALRSGATAIAPAFAACAPQACYEVHAAWKDGDQPLAEEKQQRIEAAASFAETLGPAALKYGCDLNGYYGGPARLPWLPLSAADRDALDEHMHALRT